MDIVIFNALKFDKVYCSLKKEKRTHLLSMKNYY